MRLARILWYGKAEHSSLVPLAAVDGPTALPATLVDAPCLSHLLQLSAKPANNKAYVNSLRLCFPDRATHPNPIIPFDRRGCWMLSALKSRQPRLVGAEEVWKAESGGAEEKDGSKEESG